jgi:hypothetical protein
MSAGGTVSSFQMPADKAAGNRELADPALLISSLVVRQGVYTDGMSLSIRSVDSRNA